MLPVSARLSAMVAWPLPSSWRFYLGYARLRSPKVLGRVRLDPAAEPRVLETLAGLGVEVRDRRVDVGAFRAFVLEAEYRARYAGYYTANLVEKALEHFLAKDLLGLGPDDVYVDIASEDSPVPEIYGRLTGCETYAQDLAFEAGLHGRRIGGDAAAMPVADGFATAMALHCSFGHFEGDSDRGFVAECGRVLKPGGRAVVVPLYLADHYAIQTDPAVSVTAGVEFEADATLHAARRWGNRHGRFYDPIHLVGRLVTPNTGRLGFWIARFTNLDEIDPRCYARFALVIDRPVPGSTAAGQPSNVKDDDGLD